MNLKSVRENADEVRRILELRRCKADVDRMVELDAERRRLATERDEARHSQKEISKDVAAAKREGRDPKDIFERAKKLSGAWGAMAREAGISTMASITT